MIIYEMRKPVDCTSGNCVMGENLAFTQEFYIRGITDKSISYTLHLRFADGSVNSVTPDLVQTDVQGTKISWIVKKNDILRHGYFELQIEGRNNAELVFQTEIVRMFADESIPVEDKEYENPNSETLRLRDEIYQLFKEIDELKNEIKENIDFLKESDWNTKADKETVDTELDKKADKATTLSGYGITDAYTKTDSKSRFALSVSVLFDENDVPIKTSDLYILSAGYATSNLNVKTAFVSSKVTRIESGAFTGCSNLTDVYIDNINKQITIEDGAIPDTATIHYVDDYNMSSQIENALKNIEVQINSKADKSDIYTKQESKTRFALPASVLFDENDIPIKISEADKLQAGFATNNLNAKTAFISSKVSYVAGGAFTGCSNLTDVYIDNIIGGIGIASGSIPDTATIHYVDDFNTFPQILNVLLKYNGLINAKYDASNIESGHGDFGISESMSERVQSASFEYQKTGDWAELYVYIDFKAFTPPSVSSSYIRLSNLPYVCKNHINPREICITTQKKQMVCAIASNSSELTFLFLNTDEFVEGERLSFSIKYKIS